MKKKIQAEEKIVYKATTPAFMKFIPVKDFEVPVEVSKTSFITGVKQFFSNIVPNKMSKLRQQNSKKEQKIEKETSNIPKKTANQLKYVKRLTNDEFLIGNEDQLDAIQVSGIIDGFINTQYLWSINLNKAILHVQIDTRKNYIIVLPKGELLVFHFKPKYIQQFPTLLCSIKLDQFVKFIQVVKQSSIAVCYSKGIEVYSINEEAKQIVCTLKKSFEIKNPNIKLFQIPQPCQNILNIFFQQCSQKGDIFSIWNIQIEFLYSQIKMSKIKKIYDLPIEMKKVVILQNYSKEICFINLGEKIIAIKKGYFIDSARVDKKTDDSHLKYFSYSKLLHISVEKMQIYKFTLNTNMIPAKIYLQSNDSIQIPFSDSNYEYLNAIQLNGDNYAIFYQIKAKSNKLKHGQLKYAFVLTETLKLQEKIKDIFPESVKSINIERIQVKADMATKMGLQRKNIYLKLWNSSSKSSVQDYQLLLDTLDYDAIKMQIQKKLKKNSMSLRQIILIQQGCLSMLSANVFKQDNTKEHIKNYMISHLLIRKLQFYKQITMIDKNSGKKISQDQQGKLLINIQNYNYYKTFDIKSMLIQLIGQFCNEDKDQIQKIRTLWKTFRFSLKTIYLDILSSIVEVSKKKFIKILQQIPELLPYDQNAQQNGVTLQGIWSNLSEQQWQKSLYIDNLVTIQNQQNVKQLCQSVWFKRYWLNQHDYVHLNRAQIQQIQDKTCSDASFYHTIDQVFQIIKDEVSRHTIIDYIQDKYMRLPNHILGKIFLYYKLYGLFKGNQKEIIIEDKRIKKFSQFLNLKDPYIFRAIFNYQKQQKGFILKDMKRIYTELSSSQTFPEGLLNYFVSSLSQISDIKYLLNRINNQKREFHEQYQEIYEVLVRGIQLKLKLGEFNNIPADQVLIYIQNIPLSPQNPLLKDLQTMKAINRQSKRFKRLKINMSIFYITKNPDQVLAAVISRQVQHSQILKTDNLQVIRQMSFKIIEDIEALKNNLYDYSQDNGIVAFIFLTKLLEEEPMIEVVASLIQNDIFKRYDLNETKIENIVLFMYKWKLNLNSSYVESSNYLKKLILLLPQKNTCRMYIEAEVQIAIMLSTPENSINYPLNNGQSFFSSSELQKIIVKIGKEYLLKIDFDKLYEHVHTLQIISTDRKQAELTLKVLYQIVVIKMMDCNLLVEVFQKIRQLMQMDGEQLGGYKYIYLCHIISKIVPELVEQNKIILLQCASYLFNKPKVLLNILQELINLVCTTSEQKKFLLKALSQSKKQNITYFVNNPILQNLYVCQAQSSQEQQNLMNIQKAHIRLITKIKQQYSQPYYYNSYIILCNDPYVLPAYIFSIRNQINFKQFRSFFNVITKEQIFNKKNTIQFAKRLFIIVYQTIKTGQSIHKIIDLFRNIPLQDNNIFQKTVGKSSIQRIVIQSIESMKNQAKIFTNQLAKKTAKGQLQDSESKKNRIKQRLNGSGMQININEYLSLQSDDYLNKSNVKDEQKACAFLVELLIPQFDADFERTILINRNGKSLRTYLSSSLQKEYRNEYNQLKEQRNNIFKDLSIDKNKEIPQNGNTQGLNDVIRNYIRRSRSQNTENKQRQGFSAIKSNIFLSAIASTPKNQQSLPSNSNVNAIQNAENIENIENIVLYSRPSCEFKVELLQPKQNIVLPIEVQKQEVQIPAQIEQIYQNKLQVQDIKQQRQQVPEIKTQEIQSATKEQKILQQIIQPKEQIQQPKEIAAQNDLKEQSFLKQPALEPIQKPNQTYEPQIIQDAPQIQTIQQIVEQNHNLSEEHQEKTSNLLNFLGNTELQIQIIDTLLNEQKIISAQSKFNLEVFKLYQSHQKFNNLVEEVISLLYDKINMPMESILLIIKALSEEFPTLQINKQFLEIYDRAEKLQSKFNLDLPLKILFGFEGLFIKSQSTDVLFKYLLPRIIDNLNEEQLLKACKVITLSFKKSQLEQQIMFKYLLTLFYKYQYDSNNPSVHERQKDMLREKIEVILGKISVKLLKKKEEQIIAAVIHPQMLREIMKLIILSCRSRSDTKVADYFQAKYLKQEVK